MEVEGDEKGESSHITDDKNVWADEVRIAGLVFESCLDQWYGIVN